MVKKGATVSLSGLIQGIGFRPFIYRIAVRNRLKGFVKNLGDAGVLAVVNGEEGDIRSFLKDLKSKKPPLAIYTSVKVAWTKFDDRFKDFRIEKSDAKGSAGIFSFIPPDISICDECVKDLLNPSDRHHLYPFTCCADCGPRFTTIKLLPYDRERTTMDEFPLCLYCDKEFNDFNDRRLNAQTICCPLCGPSMTLYDASGNRIQGENAIKLASKLIDDGYILAVKGIGGIHLATVTTVDDPILRLRERRRKYNKPFAIMSLNVDTVRSYAIVSKREEKLLTSYARPIVVLLKRDPFPLSKYISPGLHTVGVMLPYSGIHHLLLRYCKEPAIVMTSANFPNEPMITSNEEAFAMLKDVADYFLLHDRKIWARCDDSVVRMVGDEPTFLRRSRGYAPLPIFLPFHYDREIVAVGPELMSTVAILKENKCYLSQHIGDVENLEELNFLEEAVKHLSILLRIRDVGAIACDLHPLFLSRKVAVQLIKQSKAPLVEVQHHHAHVASLMVDRGLSLGSKIIGIACDGVGYGLDGTVWGGEVLISGYDSFIRGGHLEPQLMPGGDLCAYRYGRMLQGILYGKIPDDELRRFLVKNCLRGYLRGGKEVDMVFQQLERRLFTFTTTSAGRLLDAVACLLGICYTRTYEGEGAMKLEAEAAKGDAESIELPIEMTRDGDKLILMTSSMITKLYELRGQGLRREDLAASFQRALADGLAKMAIELAKRYHVNQIGFTGGVAYNHAITTRIKSRVEKEGFKFLRHRKVPNGDGGISLGQVAVAASRLIKVETNGDL